MPDRSITEKGPANRKRDELAKTNEATKTLQTIPGVGPRTAEAVAAFLPEPKRFKTTKQVSAYGGLVPRQYQSTDTDHRGRITKRGPRTSRKLLVECAWCIRRDAETGRDLSRQLAALSVPRSGDTSARRPERMGDAAYEMTGPAGCTMAETRIVECIPNGVGARRTKVGIPAGDSKHRASTRGLIAAPWTPASHLPCSRGKTDWRMLWSKNLVPGGSQRCVTDWKNTLIVG
jgi:hypothetical protein